MTVDPILDRKTVEAETNLSRSTIDRLEEKNMFPKRLKISVRRVGWRRSQIEQWIQSRCEKIA